MFGPSTACYLVIVSLKRRTSNNNFNLIGIMHNVNNKLSSITASTGISVFGYTYPGFICIGSSNEVIEVVYLDTFGGHSNYATSNHYVSCAFAYN